MKFEAKNVEYSDILKYFMFINSKTKKQPVIFFQNKNEA